MVLMGFAWFVPALAFANSPAVYTLGFILGVGIDVSKESYLDLEMEAAGAFARD